MDEWTKGIWIFIELSISALLLVSGIVLAQLSGDIGRVQQREVDAIAITKEYRIYNRYDDKDITPQDIISLIFETRGKPEVWVEVDIDIINDNFAYEWTTDVPSWSYLWDLTEVTENIIPTVADYESSIVRNANGEIIRIECRRVS